MDVYYYAESGRAVGPHSLREVQELFALATISPATPVIRQGEVNWQTLAAYCDLSAPECQLLDLGFDDLFTFAPVLPAANGTKVATAEAAPMENITSTADSEAEVTTAALAPEIAVEPLPAENESEALPEELPEGLTDAAEALDEQPVALIEVANLEQQESIEEENEAIRQQRTTKHQQLRQIRRGLDELWEAQREAIIARIRFEPLEKSYEATRRRNREIYREIESVALDYWRRSGVLTYWIRDLTWRDHDFTFRLKGKTEAEKYASLQQWLDETRLGELAGCYAFKNGKEYVYIGQGGVLRDRIKQHEKKTYFTYSTAVRVIIPKHKRRLNQLERLMILAHLPSTNGNAGIAGRNPIDDCLDFVKGEIKELITDF